MNLATRRDRKQPEFVFADTSVIVDVDRGKKTTIELCRHLTSDSRAMISTVTVSEILTGSYLRSDYSAAVSKAEKVLGQFVWIPLSGEIAKMVAQLNSYLISKGLPIEYEDVAIAGSCLVENCGIMLTENEEHFERFPKLKDRVMNSEELSKKLRL